MAGSVRVKAESPIMRDSFKRFVSEWADRRCRFILLKVPPATGAVLWALELANGAPPAVDVRRRVIAAIEKLQIG